MSGSPLGERACDQGVHGMGPRWTVHREREKREVRPR
jgi:hypothetical protein